MRISDWSSDVCSSDLQVVFVAIRLHACGALIDTDAGRGLGCGRTAVDGEAAESKLAVDVGGDAHFRQNACKDVEAEAHDLTRSREVGGNRACRKSVGYGKRGSGRVDLGVRRILNKNHHTAKT